MRQDHQLTIRSDRTQQNDAIKTSLSISHGLCLPVRLSLSVGVAIGEKESSFVQIDPPLYRRLSVVHKDSHQRTSSVRGQATEVGPLPFVDGSGRWWATAIVSAIIGPYIERKSPCMSGHKQVVE